MSALVKLTDSFGFARKPDRILSQEGDTYLPQDRSAIRCCAVTMVSSSIVPPRYTGITISPFWPALPENASRIAEVMPDNDSACEAAPLSV